MPKLRVTKKIGDDNSATNNSIAHRTPIEKYAPFGEMAQQFQSQGWYPTSTQGTEFRPQYGLFSDVPLNNGKDKGYVAIDHAGGGLFNLSIKDSNGNVIQKLADRAVPKDINTFLTQYGNQHSQGNYNPPSPIAQRVAQIAQQQALASK